MPKEVIKVRAEIQELGTEQKRVREALDPDPSDDHVGDRLTRYMALQRRLSFGGVQPQEIGKVHMTFGTPRGREATIAVRHQTVP